MLPSAAVCAAMQTHQPTAALTYFSLGFAMALHRRERGGSPSGPRDGPPSPSLRRSSSRNAPISFSENRAIASMAKFDPVGE